MLEQERVTGILLLCFLLIAITISAGDEKVPLRGTSSTANSAKRKASQLLSAFLTGIHVDSTCQLFQGLREEHTLKRSSSFKVLALLVRSSTPYPLSRYGINTFKSVEILAFPQPEAGEIQDIFPGQFPRPDTNMRHSWNFRCSHKESGFAGIREELWPFWNTEDWGGQSGD